MAPGNDQKPDDTARFVSRLTDLPLITKIEDIEIDEKRTPPDFTKWEPPRAGK